MAGPTHEVFNQAGPFPPLNLFRADVALQEAVAAHGGAWDQELLEAYGALAGGRLAEQGRLANIHRPQLRTHDAFGRRLDTVEFHPAYHELMRTAVAHGVHGLAWEGHEGGHAAQAALQFLHNQADAGTSCPLTMTYASIPTLRANPALAEHWMPRILSRRYDRSERPFLDKSGLTLGMAMTEKQGGSDVRANTTRAMPRNETVLGGECFGLTGHKWFCSAPMSDGFLTLAQMDEGLTCFLLPRRLPDGERNAMYMQRLKDKLGNHSNASAEVEFDDAFAWLVGEPGRGIATIIKMVALTRFNCMVGSAALMRNAALRAAHHVSHRSAFGKKLVDQPLMRNVLADLLLESEAAMWLVFRTARALDAPTESKAEHFIRLATPLGKYWICKRAPAHINEAQECLGGFGYIEDSVLPRLYREAPVNSIWEGSGNLQCLDVVRALKRTPEVLDVLRNFVGAMRGINGVYDAAMDDLDQALIAEPDEGSARHLAERAALLLEARLLLEHAPERVANAFIRSRLTPRSFCYGCLEDDAAIAWLLNRIQLD